jgi:hypothetical protein
MKKKRFSVERIVAVLKQAVVFPLPVERFY